ncbi:MAG: GNAT family N-acetyltransferase [Egibacteraceae bacterium]
MEQDARHPELDGRDREPGTWNCWIEEDGEVVAYLRILTEPGGKPDRAGGDRARGAWAGPRVAVDAARAGLAAPPVVLYAQVHLSDWYARFGFDPAVVVDLRVAVPAG